MLSHRVDLFGGDCISVLLLFNYYSVIKADDMMWMKTTWELIKTWSSASWEAIKKLPGWAVVALLVLGSFVVHLLKRNALTKKRAEAQKKLADINIEYMAAKVEAETAHTERTKALREEREIKRSELDEIDQEIDEASKKGPVALANEWKDYLSGKRK